MSFICARSCSMKDMSSSQSPPHHDQTTLTRSSSQRETLEGPKRYLVPDSSREARSHKTYQPYTTMTNTVTRRKTPNEYQLDLLSHLADDFAGLLNRTDISDCSLCVQGTYMAVHRCVLVARSNTFSAVISGTVNRLDTDTRSKLQTLKEGDRLVIVIDKTKPDVMQEVIIFMYTAQCDLNQHNAYALLDAAGRYDIKSLKVHAAQYLINHIDINSILRLLEVAYKYDNILLRQHCIAYFLSHSKEIMDIHEPWKEFTDNYPALVAELLYWTVHPDEFTGLKQTSSRQQSQWE